jgi:hypothetical protein
MERWKNDGLQQLRVHVHGSNLKAVVDESGLMVNPD